MMCGTGDLAVIPLGEMKTERSLLLRILLAWAVCLAALLWRVSEPMGRWYIALLVQGELINSSTREYGLKEVAISLAVALPGVLVVIGAFIFLLVPGSLLLFRIFNGSRTVARDVLVTKEVGFISQLDKRWVEFWCARLLSREGEPIDRDGPPSADAPGGHSS